MSRQTRREKEPISSDLPDPEKAGRRYRETSTIWAVKMNRVFRVVTLEGVMKGKRGDYLAKGVEGELYCIDQEIFEKTYEEVDE